MRVLVLDIAASESGAITILNDFYDECKKEIYSNNEYIFLLGTHHLNQTDHIRVINYPNTKKSWFHRLYFDKFKLKKIIKLLNVDIIISLQNIAIPNCSIPQYLYIHNSLPFVNFKYKIYQDLKLWTYQNILKYSIIKSIKHSKCTIVQANWFKNEVKKIVPSSKVIVCEPHISCYYYTNNNKHTNGRFIYPATCFDYKNHIAIIEALKLIEPKLLENIEVLFTLNGNENSIIIKYYDEVMRYNLPVRFIGNIEKDELLKYYQNYNLIFPSYIESYGLPLYEARESNTYIIASDTSHSHDILDNYYNKVYFDPFDYQELSQKIISCAKQIKLYPKINITSEMEKTLFEAFNNEIENEYLKGGIR